ncbi:uncharacterized protein LOC111704367 [Eurytemora carolleeae]|uniref:uncharacterized protein LOC111704367 n=1 Tax=Eurytemora carolleeae TaxID=1294199 RepID=UPI000C78901E|nr:uncharacterized protein LOC111704367 [Eurytemora carolleeae]|eukprot:XP_023332361.1 uncharacterized protein LOC111704367 [Eurytemora affinis]
MLVQRGPVLLNSGSTLQQEEEEAPEISRIVDNLLEISLVQNQEARVETRGRVETRNKVDADEFNGNGLVEDGYGTQDGTETSSSRNSSIISETSDDPVNTSDDLIVEVELWRSEVRDEDVELRIQNINLQLENLKNERKSAEQDFSCVEIDLEQTKPSEAKIDENTHAEQDEDHSDQGAIQTKHQEKEDENTFSEDQNEKKSTEEENKNKLNDETKIESKFTEENEKNQEGEFDIENTFEEKTEIAEDVIKLTKDEEHLNKTIESSTIIEQNESLVQFGSLELFSSTSNVEEGQFDAPLNVEEETIVSPPLKEEGQLLSQPLVEEGQLVSPPFVKDDTPPLNGEGKFVVSSPIIKEEIMSPPLNKEGQLVSPPLVEEGQIVSPPSNKDETECTRMDCYEIQLENNLELTRGDGGRLDTPVRQSIHRVTFNTRNEVASEDKDGSLLVTYCPLEEKIKRRERSPLPGREPIKVKYVERTAALSTAPRIIDFNDSSLLEQSNQDLNDSSEGEEGWENPFQPEGEVSQDADIILQLWKGGNLNQDLESAFNQVQAEKLRVPEPEVSVPAPEPAPEEPEEETKSPVVETRLVLVEKPKHKSLLKKKHCSLM